MLNAKFSDYLKYLPPLADDEFWSIIRVDMILH
jgi:hypothetical protein